MCVCMCVNGNPQLEAIGHTQTCLQPESGRVLCTVCSLVNWERLTPKHGPITPPGQRGQWRYMQLSFHPQQCLVKSASAKGTSCNSPTTNPTEHGHMHVCICASSAGNENVGNFYEFQAQCATNYNCHIARGHNTNAAASIVWH